MLQNVFEDLVVIAPAGFVSGPRLSHLEADPHRGHGACADSASRT